MAMLSPITTRPTCIVANCLYNANQSYAVIPREWNVRVLWLRILEREDFLDFPGELFVCFKHFRPEMFHDDGIRLVPNALPYLEVKKFPPTQCIPVQIFPEKSPSLNFQLSKLGNVNGPLQINNTNNSFPAQMKNVADSHLSKIDNASEMEDVPKILHANVASQTAKMLMRNLDVEKHLKKERRALRYQLMALNSIKKKILRQLYTRQLFKQQAEKILSPDLAAIVKRTASFRKKNRLPDTSEVATSENASSEQSRTTKKRKISEVKSKLSSNKMTLCDNNGSAVTPFNSTLQDGVPAKNELLPGPLYDKIEETGCNQIIPEEINITVVKDPISDELNIIINEFLS